MFRDRGDNKVDSVSKKRYEISVIIPTYNRADHIKKSVESVLAQTGQGELFDIIEVLVIDDGSTDNTDAVVTSIADERIRLYRMDVNSGAAAARNKGVDIAIGEWIAFQDSDDVWHEDKLKKQVEYLKSQPGCSMVSHPIRAYFEDGSDYVSAIAEGDDIVSLLAKRNYYGTPTMLIKREAFNDIGGFDIELNALEDWEFALRFAAKYQIGMVDEALIDSDMILEGVSADASAYYESRCKMIAWNRFLLIQHDCFNEAVRSLLTHAQKNDVLDSVGKMFELILGEEL